MLPTAHMACVPKPHTRLTQYSSFFIIFNESVHYYKIMQTNPDKRLLNAIENSILKCKKQSDDVGKLGASLHSRFPNEGQIQGKYRANEGQIQGNVLAKPAGEAKKTKLS
jgi:hypothetical protein